MNRPTRELSLRKKKVRYFFVPSILILVIILSILVKPITLLLIDAYQEYISPHKGYSCAYHVLHKHSSSCSEYGKQVINKNGIIRGYHLLQHRLLQCQAAYSILQTISDNTRILIAEYQVSDNCESLCEDSCKQPCKKIFSDLKMVALQTIQNLWNEICQFIKDTFITIKDSILSFINKIKYVIISAINETIQTVRVVMDNFKKQISSFVKSKCEKKLEKYGTIENDITFAFMSECAYGGSRCDNYVLNLQKKGWIVMKNSEDLHYSVEYAEFRNNTIGMHVIAFRGTELLNINDWVSNIGSSAVAQKLGLNVEIMCRKYSTLRCDQIAGGSLERITKQFLYKKKVEKFASSYVNRHGKGNVLFTGHSKGGGEALWAGNATGAKVVVFNPRSEAKTGDLYSSTQAKGYYLEGEILHFGRLNDSQELQKIPYSRPESPFKRHTMKHLLIGMKFQVDAANIVRTACKE